MEGRRRVEEDRRRGGGGGEERSTKDRRGRRGKVFVVVSTKPVSRFLELY